MDQTLKIDTTVFICWHLLQHKMYILSLLAYLLNIDVHVDIAIYLVNIVSKSYRNRKKRYRSITTIR